MSTLLDYIASSLVFGVLVLTVSRVQLNINSALYQNQFNVVTQTNAVELARQIEHDFLKIGYHASGDPLLFADSTSIRFRADLNNTWISDEVDYSVGTPSAASSTLNPNDFPLYRKVDGNTLKQNFGLTSLKLSYFDSSSTEIPRPLTTSAQLARVRAIQVEFRVESPEPVYRSYDTTWVAVTWQKVILPRNLNNYHY